MMTKKIKTDHPIDFDFSSLHRKLIRWYRHQGRNLPWRETNDPYRIWVSEIMLQQTQVTTVIPYYQRFLAAFPSVSSLARAPLKKVLKLWEGAGYYARARNLHKAAQTVMNKWNGKIPEEPSLLETLPGIGRSTAGAISSLAFGRRAPILDGNVRRVLCRLFGIEENPRKPAVERRLWELSEASLPNLHVDQFNQALMDLGATVCTPVRPACLLCPVRTICRAFSLGIQEKIPVKLQRAPLPRYQIWVAVILNGSRLLIGQRPENGLLGGLWGLPEVRRENSDAAEICKIFENQTGLSLQAIRALEPVIHTFTHFRMTFYPEVYRYQNGQFKRDQSWKWANGSTLAGLPISVATRKILKQVLLPDHNVSVDWTVPVAAEKTSTYFLRRP